MDLQEILAIIELSTGLAQTAVSGTKIAGAVTSIMALEQIVGKALALHMSEVGTPMDVTKFHHEDRIE